MNSDIALLDIGSSRISVLIGSHGPNKTVQITAAHHLKFDVYYNGKWFDKNQLYLAIKTAVLAVESARGIKIKRLYVGVPAEFSSVIAKKTTISFDKSKKITSLDIEKLKKNGLDSVANPSLTIIHDRAISYTLDDGRSLIMPEGEKTKLLTGFISYIFAENKFVLVLKKILTQIGILDFKFICPTLAQAMFLIDHEIRDRTAVLIDCGYLSTTVALVRGDGILSLKTMNLGGANVSFEIGKRLDIDLSLAEAIKQRISVTSIPSASDTITFDNGILGQETEYSMSEAVQGAIEAVVQIGDGAKQLVDMCEFDVPQNMVVFLTGGGISFIRGAREIVQMSLSERETVLAKMPPPHLEKHQNSSIVSLLDMILDETEQGLQKKSVMASIIGFLLGD